MEIAQGCHNLVGHIIMRYHIEKGLNNEETKLLYILIVNSKCIIQQQIFPKAIVIICEGSRATAMLLYLVNFLPRVYAVSNSLAHFEGPWTKFYRDFKHGWADTTIIHRKF